MELIDNHTHLHDSRIIARLPVILEECADVGFRYFINNGTSEDDWEDVAKLSKQYPQVVPCFGLHPWYISTRSKDWLSILTQYLSKYNGGVGEIGLDHEVKDADFQDQEEVFIAQIELAKKLNLPFVVHCWKAWDRLLGILNQLKPFPAHFMVHNFNGSAEDAKRLISFGAYLSASTILLRPNHNKLIKIFMELPPDRLLVETDSPDLSVTTYSCNTPKNVLKVLELFATVQSKPIKEVAAQIWQNSTTLWGNILSSR